MREAKVLFECVRTLRCNDGWLVTNRSKFSREGTNSCSYTVAVGKVSVCENADSQRRSNSELQSCAGIA
jgi:hypothetical protein